VASSVPAAGVDDVGLVPLVEITFSEPMNAATINDTTITLTAAGAETAPTITVSYDAGEHRAVCFPDSTLAALVSYTVSCSDAVTDAAGNALESPWSASFTTGPADCAHLADRFEDNDILADAITLERDVWCRTLTECDEDGDYFRFTVDDTAKVRLECFMRYVADGSWYTEFFRADGESYTWTSSGPTSGETTVRTYTFFPGTYYVRALGQQASHTLYDIKWSMGAPCADDLYEDNDFVDEAAAITPGTYEGLRGCWVDRDYFAVEATAGQTLTATATSTYTGTRRMRISDAQGTQLAYYNGPNEPSTVEATITTTGTHYVMMRVWSDDVTYDLTVELTD